MVWIGSKETIYAQIRFTLAAPKVGPAGRRKMSFTTPPRLAVWPCGMYYDLVLKSLIGLLSSGLFFIIIPYLIFGVILVIIIWLVLMVIFMKDKPALKEAW